MVQINKKRDYSIDFARGLATLLIPLIHVVPYFFKVRFAYAFFNWSQFVLPLIVYATFKNTNLQTLPQNYFSYIFKRLKRLYIPYLVFFAFYLLITFVMRHKLQSTSYIVASLLLYGGISFNWLVLLYVIYAAFMPLLSFVFVKNKSLFVIINVAFVLTSVLYLFNPNFHNNYLLYMAPPWLALGIFCTLYKNISRRWHIFIFVINALAFGAMQYSLPRFGFTLGFYLQKYPPTIYYLSFCILTIYVFSIINKIPQPNLLKKFFEYLSVNSYSIFFIHLLVILFLDLQFPRRNLSIGTFTIVVYGTTFVINYAVNKLLAHK